MSEFNANYPQQQQQYGYPPQQYGGNNSQQQQMGNYPQQPPAYGGSYPQQQSQQQWGSYPEQQHQEYVEPPSYVHDQGGSKAGRTYVAGESPWRSSVAEAEGQEERFSGFSDKDIRRGFLQKVYGILMCQLVVTGGIMAVIMFVQDIKDWVFDNTWILYVSMGVTLACVIALACVPGVRRKSPGNIICLAIFTVAEAVLLGVVASTYDVDAVLMAVGTTAGVTLALTIFAFQTKIDFTGCGGALLCVLVIFCITGIFFAFIPSSRYAQIGYSAVGAVIFSLYIIYDTQIMLGGNHKYSLSPEEYIFAALNLYLDIVNLFLYLLSIFGGGKK